MADQQPDARRRGKAPKAAAAAAAAPADGNGQQQAPRGGRRPRLNEDEAEKVIIDTDVFVKQLPAEFQKEDLQNKFAAFGEIKQFRLRVRQRRPMLSVSYADAASAKKAIDALNGSVYNGSTLSVEIRRSIKRPDEPQQQQQQQQSQQQSQQPQQKKRERKPRNNNNNNNNNNNAAAAAAAAPAEEQRAAPNPNNVWVGGISNTVTEADLRGFFGSGDYTVAVRGRFAILSFPDPSGAKKALDKNGQKLGEYEIKVEAEKGRKIRSNNNNNNNNGGNNNNNNGSSGSSGKSSGRPRRRRPRPANPKRLYFRNFVREVNDADVKAKFPGIQRILHLGKLGMVIFDTEENANAALALKEAEFSGVKITIEKGREAPKDGAAAPSQ